MSSWTAKPSMPLLETILISLRQSGEGLSGSELYFENWTRSFKATCPSFDCRTCDLLKTWYFSTCPSICTSLLSGYCLPISGGLLLCETTAIVGLGLSASGFHISGSFFVAVPAENSRKSGLEVFEKISTWNSSRYILYTLMLDSDILKNTMGSCESQKPIRFSTLTPTSNSAKTLLRASLMLIPSSASTRLESSAPAFRATMTTESDRHSSLKILPTW